MTKATPVPHAGRVWSPVKQARSRQLDSQSALVVGGPVRVARDHVRETQHHHYHERDDRSDNRDRQEHHGECD